MLSCSTVNVLDAQNLFAYFGALQGFKCVSGEMIFVRDISRSQASFSLQLKVPFSSNFTKNSKIISVADQVFIAVFLCLLYKVVVFIYTYITTT